MSCRHKLIIISLVFLFPVFTLKAQSNALHQILSTLQSRKNISYDCVYRQKDFTDDTLIQDRRDVLVKASADKATGYYFTSSYKDQNMNGWEMEIYNGHGLFNCDLADSSYTTNNSQAVTFRGTLLGNLNWLDGFIDKHPAKFTKQPDTTIANQSLEHWKLVTRDTVIGKEHLYTNFHILINKQAQLPYIIRVNARTDQLGAGIVNATNSYTYTNYRLDEPDLDTAAIQLPKGVHPHVDNHPKAPLANGTAAPPWSLTSTDGKQVTLTDLKGKVIVIDYFFIGCEGCMLSIPALNRLHQRFKGKNVVFVSVDDHDKKETLAAFKKKFKLQYPVYYDGKSIVKSYRLYAAPLFYIIDKKGQIAFSHTGYNDDMESKMGEKITALLTGK